ncbi:DUF5681 domain-containing protein [Sphingomonas parva]|uniref:DUF5681 domain-containing protein n=1 Tax=Sphingomonas parva TaxID=2555898 RepID=UPI00177F13CB|nr:DUF5681 domain-containing protein [Sphingomonas parva]
MLEDDDRKTRRGRPRFAPGRSGNPRGRPPGARNEASLAVEALLEGEAAALTRKAVEMALDGDRVALRLCLERIAPRRRDVYVSFELPPIETAEDVEKAGAALIAAVAAGRVPVGEADKIMALLVAQKGLIEAGEHERRLTRLEEKFGRRRGAGQAAPPARPGLRNHGDHPTRSNRSETAPPGRDAGNDKGRQRDP